jgi:hypothetical protein
VYTDIFAAFVWFTPSFPSRSPVFTMWHAYCFVCNVAMQYTKNSIRNERADTMKKSLTILTAALGLTISACSSDPAVNRALWGIGITDAEKSKGGATAAAIQAFAAGAAAGWNSVPDRPVQQFPQRSFTFISPNGLSEYTIYK